MKTVAYDSKYTDAVVALWNQTLVVDPMTKQRFLQNVTLDDNFSPELCRVALDGDRVIGFIWAVSRKVPYGERGLEPTRGWIVLLFVDQAYQRQGVGTQLVQEVEAIFATQKKQLITLAAYSPNYLFPGVDNEHYAGAIDFFTQLGYTKGPQAVSMHRELFNFKFPEAYPQFKAELEAEGFRLSNFKLDDAEELIDFLKVNFGGGWARNVKQALLSGRGEDTLLVVKDKNAEIVGYCQRAIDGNPDRFGPFGVKESLRGKHIGVLLFNEMLFDMLKKEIHNVYFLWTGGSAQRFYAKNGMEVYRDYTVMKKEVKD